MLCKAVSRPLLNTVVSRRGLLLRIAVNKRRPVLQCNHCGIIMIIHIQILIFFLCHQLNKKKNWCLCLLLMTIIYNHQCVVCVLYFTVILDQKGCSLISNRTALVCMCPTGYWCECTGWGGNRMCEWMRIHFGLFVNTVNIMNVEL